MNNTLGNLNNILFEQLKRLNDDKLKGEELTKTGILIADLYKKMNERK